MSMEKTSAALSIPRGETVRGYEVKRLTLGEYLRVMEALRETPEHVLRACFPGLGAADVLEALKGIDERTLTDALLRAMEILPLEALRLLALLTGVPEEALYTDPAIGLDGAAEMVEAFWRLNGMENFTRAARRLAAKLQAQRKNAGFKG